MSTIHKSILNAVGFSLPNGGGFEYPYLPNDGHHFRLIQLFADKDNAPIRCELFTAERSDWDQQYFAISYVWGQKEHTAPILVNGYHLKVRTNLFNFLTAFRRYTRGNNFEWSIIWIDAICIDQRTTAEKNHQVQTMGQIFRDAACVFAWLGQSETEWSTKAYEDMLRHIDNDTMKDMYGGALAHLVNHNAYWSRLWIVQEVLLARNLLYLYGTAVCRKNSMEQAIATDEENEIGRYSRLRTLRDYNSFRTRSFADLFRAFGCLGCSLDHDRVFGLLGIANLTQNKPNIRVDYSMSRGALFKETNSLVSDSQRFDFVQDFVFAVRLTVEDIDIEPSGTWDYLFDESLSPDIECWQGPVRWESRAISNIATSLRQITIAEGSIHGRFESVGGYSMIVADPVTELSPVAYTIQTPLNPHFPSKDASMFESCLIFRLSEGTGSLRIDHSRRCNSSSPASTYTLSGIGLKTSLLSKLRGDSAPALPLAEVIRLQDLLRVVIDTSVSECQSVETQTLPLEQEPCKMHLPFLPYLRFLAQLRHVIVLLDQLPELAGPAAVDKATQATQTPLAVQ